VARCMEDAEFLLAYFQRLTVFDMHTCGAGARRCIATGASTSSPNSIAPLR
jgi:hypothetical protein